MVRSWVRHSGALMVAVGLLLRLGSVAYQYRYHLNPALDHWRFGWEMGRVGRAIYEGRGFSSPLYEPSGPTAWVAPVYPLLIAAGFKLFGIYTAGAAWFILGLNSLFGALTALPIQAMVRYVFGKERLANIAGWTWALLPYSIYLAGERIWEDTLITLLAACLLALTYKVERDGRMRTWLLWGFTWGVAALTSTALLAALPAMGLWMAWRHQRQRRKWVWPATVSALVFAALMGPWMARNYVAFHRLIPVRDNLWLEVHVGNNGDHRQPCPDAVHPSNSVQEREEWARYGEIGYMDAKKAEAKDYIRQHPAEFVELSTRRALFVWTGFWSASPEFLRSESMELIATVYFTLMTVVAAMGFVAARRRGLGPMLIPMVLFLLFYPAPYYITHPSHAYRHPMDPVLVVMMTYAFVYARKPEVKVPELRRLLAKAS